MTDQTVADGQEQSGLPNELRGQFDRRIDELKRRLNEGTLDFQSTMNGVQRLIEAKQKKFKVKFKVLGDIGIVTHPDGWRFRVEIYEHARKDMITSSQERLDCLAARGATLLGQCGLDLLTTQGLRERLPKGFWYASFEPGNRRRVPLLHAHSGGGWAFGAGHLEGDWRGYIRLLCFVEVK